MTKQSNDSGSTTSRSNSAEKDGALRDGLRRADEIVSGELKRHKTDELRERFDQLFGVTHFLPWAAAGLGGSVVTLLVLWGVLFLPQASLPVVVLTFVYMGLQGLAVGVVAAALLIVARIFQQLSAIVDITVQTLRETLADLKQLTDPEKRGELTAALVHGAVVPAIQSVITVKMGLLRAPIGAVLNWLLEKTAGRLTSGLRETIFAGDDDGDETSEPDDAVPEDQSRDLADIGDSHLVRVRDRIDAVARRTRRATLIPAGIVFALVAGLSSIPWIVALLVLV